MLRVSVQVHILIRDFMVLMITLVAGIGRVRSILSLDMGGNGILAF